MPAKVLLTQVQAAMPPRMDGNSQFAVLITMIIIIIIVARVSIVFSIIPIP